MSDEGIFSNKNFYFVGALIFGFLFFHTWSYYCDANVIPNTSILFIVGVLFWFCSVSFLMKCSD